MEYLFSSIIAPILNHVVVTHIFLWPIAIVFLVIQQSSGLASLKARPSGTIVVPIVGVW